MQKLLSGTLSKYGEHATNRLAVDELDLPQNAVIVDVGSEPVQLCDMLPPLPLKGVSLGSIPYPE